jgi:hypothetical protein
MSSNKYNLFIHKTLYNLVQKYLKILRIPNFLTENKNKGTECALFITHYRNTRPTRARFTATLYNNGKPTSIKVSTAGIATPSEKAQQQQ